MKRFDGPAGNELLQTFLARYESLTKTPFWLAVRQKDFDGRAVSAASNGLKLGSAKASSRVAQWSALAMKLQNSACTMLTAKRPVTSNSKLFHHNSHLTYSFVFHCRPWGDACNLSISIPFAGFLVGVGKLLLVHGAKLGPSEDVPVENLSVRPDRHLQDFSLRSCF